MKILPIAVRSLCAFLLTAASAAAVSAPVLTSVSPNPLIAGSSPTVTMQGSGFQSGALVYMSYGNNSMIQYGSSSVTSTSVKVAVYQGPATSSTFCVKNPGSVCSNSIIVPVVSNTPAPPKVPVITSVSPNPLIAGSSPTVTIQGSGFVSGAMIYLSYGSYNMIQYGASSMTSTSVATSIYQGPATASTFCVKNPGSACSNTITVPVTSKTPAPPPPTPSAPVLTSVSPNPLPTGNVTVTIQGSGFLSGAIVNYSSGGGSAIQVQPASLTSNTITAGINQGNAASSTFTVTNPGSAASNSITVQVGGSGGGGGTSTYTLTVVNGSVANGSANNAYAAGTTVSITANAAPSGQVFQSWTGASVANANAPSTTLTMPAANTVVTANFAAAASGPIPYPVSTHPRLWVTPADLPRLASWAVSSNLTYQGLSGVLAQAVSNYKVAFPGSALTASNPAPANPYPDFGDTQGYTGIIGEENAVILAFNSLIDPNPANRIAYAQAARNLLMYAMNQAALGHASNLPFRDPLFATYNRASATGQDWPLTVDWIYNATNANGGPILTWSDKATIRNVFMMWANDCMNASTTGGDHPAGPAGAMNTLSLLPNNKPYRMASNNYYLAHARLLTMMSLALDPADDPPVNPGVPASQPGNSLRSYIQDATGAWLYEEFAMMGDPQTVAQAYNIPNNPTGAGLGLASGGLPPEGMLYGESFAYVLGQLLALQTAGFNNPAYSGPQIQMIGAPVWDRYVTGYISSLTPAAQVFPADSWEGPLYQFAGYGDMLRLWVTPDQMESFSLLALLDAQNGKNNHLNAARWFVVNALPNGANGLLSRINNPWTWGVMPSLLYYMLLDPAAPAATDPRPGFPGVFYDAPAARIVAHTDWSPSGTMFDYRASWISINHQNGEGGEFELYRKGEWLTKGMANYDNNGLGMTTPYHNTLALQNWSANSTPSLQWYETGIWANGSQWMEGMNAGDPSTVFSTGANYVYAASNLTNLYNRPNIWTPSQGATDVTQATRSIVWLNNDYIVVYDRATTNHAGLFKQFNLCLINVPAINGSVTTETNPSGQQLFIQTLLPKNAGITMFNGAKNMNPISDLEPTRYNLVVQDPTNPVDTRFLHVLQGADAGAVMSAATYLQSTSGTSFDGAAFAGTAVYFPVSVAAAFAGTTLSTPAGVHTLLVTGLAANTAYGAMVQPNAVTISANGNTATTDAGGVLKLTF